MSRIVSFRGLILDGGQDTIPLHTTNGSTGYRIKKLQAFPKDPGASDGELVIKIYTLSQTAVDAIVDLSSQTLIAVSFINNYTSGFVSGNNETIIIDNIIFNQDIYVTASDAKGSNPCNYYIELEQMPLDLNENTVATLKDIRNIARTV